jgi:hypothetical protein
VQTPAAPRTGRSTNAQFADLAGPTPPNRTREMGR